MKKIKFLAMVFCLVTGCASVPPDSIVEGTRADSDYSWFCKESFPNGQPAEKVVVPEELDVRSCDISQWDFSAYTAEELADVLAFDSHTRFPAQLPKGFSPKKILKKYRNPGLQIRRLHQNGIDGHGISVAIIDQNLLTNHQEYRSQLKYYWQDPFYQQYPRTGASMHGAAVTSILVGKTLGVAPKADVYYWAGRFHNTGHSFDARPITETLDRIMNYNFGLPEDKRIRAVSISRGFSVQDEGAGAFVQKVQELKEHGIEVFTTNDMFTLSRTHALLSPDTPDQCRPAYWERADYEGLYRQAETEQSPLVPSDFRVTASETGTDAYVAYALGGMSWAVPYLTGLYALGLQLDKNLTREQFFNLLAQTADTKECTYLGQSFTAKGVVNPQRFINVLRGRIEKKSH